jgi:hypothetical protein
MTPELSAYVMSECPNLTSWKSNAAKCRAQAWANFTNVVSNRCKANYRQQLYLYASQLFNIRKFAEKYL